MDFFSERGLLRAYFLYIHVQINSIVYISWGITRPFTNRYVGKGISLTLSTKTRKSRASLPQSSGKPSGGLYETTTGSSYGIYA